MCNYEIAYEKLKSMNSFLNKYPTVKANSGKDYSSITEYFTEFDQFTENTGKVQSNFDNLDLCYTNLKTVREGIVGTINVANRTLDNYNKVDETIANNLSNVISTYFS